MPGARHQSPGRKSRAPVAPALVARGTVPSAVRTGALELVEAVLRERWPRQLLALRQVPGSQGGGRLVFALHPAGGPIELELDGPDKNGADYNGQGRVLLRASTALAGPGYHRFVVDVAKVIGKAIGASWRPRVPRDLDQRFLSWIQHRAQHVLAEWLADRGQPPLHWLLPLSPSVGQWQGLGAVATVVGPRSEAWLQAVVADPRTGVDAFPWWGAGMDAAYSVGRARCLVWREARWRLPTCEDEVATLSEISNLLTEAWEGRPDLQDAPWAAWLNVLELLGEAQVRRDRVAARAQPGPAQGYRRYDVVEALAGGWTLTLPGRMGVSWSEAEGWVAWDQGLTAWVSIVDGRPPPLDESAEGQVLARLVSDDRRARVVRLPPDEQGDVVCVLSGQIVAGDQTALLTLAWLDDAAGRTWAEALWASVGRTG